MKIISCHHNDRLAGYFGIKNIFKLVACKYYWLTVGDNIKAYIKRISGIVSNKAQVLQ